MPCYDTGDYTCTYDSGGVGSLPGGGDPDYSIAATWETDSDNDLSGTGITSLDCYDSQAHNDIVAVAGATNTDATHYRIIQSASGCATPFEGRKDTGANFERTAAINTTIFTLSETFSRLTNLAIKLSIDHEIETTSYCVFVGSQNSKVINCVAHDSENVGGGNNVTGFYANVKNVLFYNCISYNNDGTGFYLYAIVIAGANATICCTAGNNGGYGFFADKIVGTDHPIAWSCYGANNSTADFLDNSGEWSSFSGWNSSKDTTSDLGGLTTNCKNSNDLITAGKLNSDYLALDDDLYASGGAGDNYGRNPYNDVTATYDFDDFFKNDQAGEAISKKDIKGDDRPTPDTADVSWNIGASELYEGIETLEPDEVTVELVCDQPTLLNITLTPNESVVDLVCDQPGLLDILEPNECVIDLVCDEAERICVPADTVIELICDIFNPAHLVIDWSVASTAYTTLDEDITSILYFYGARDGQICTLVPIQDDIGSRELTLPANVRGNDDVAVPVTLSSDPELTDYIIFVYRESIDKYDILSLVRGYILRPARIVIDMVCDQPQMLNLLKPNESDIDLVCDSPTLMDILEPDECVIDLVCDEPVLSNP